NVAGRGDRAPAVVEAGDQRARSPALAVALGQIDDAQLVAVVGPGRAGNERPAAVVADLGAMTLLAELGGLVDQLVRALRRAEAVEIDLLVVVERLEILPFLRLREARVEEALVADPGDAGELRPFDF